MKKNSKPVHRREFKKMVRIGLAEAEREPLVRETIQARRAWTELKAEAANVAATYRQKCKDLEDQLDEALLTLDQGRPTERDVVEERNYNTLKVRVWDKETKIEYENRAMTDEDAQTVIPDHPNATAEDEDDTDAAEG